MAQRQKGWVLLFASFNDREYTVLWGVSWKPHMKVKAQTGLQKELRKMLVASIDSSNPPQAIWRPQHLIWWNELC